MATACLAAARRFARRRRQTYIYIGIGLAALALGGAPTRSRAASMPAQGVYEYCAPASSVGTCIARLRQIAAAGFKVVVNYQSFVAYEPQLRQYMRAAARLGLTLIWPMNDYPWWGPESLPRAYPQLAASCGCSTNDAFVRYVVGLVKRSPSTWGYYVADELAPADAPRVAAFSGRLRALDRTHPRLAVANGGDDVAKLLAPFASSADVLGADSYPVGTGQPLSRVAFVGTAVRDVAGAAHRQSAMVLQAFDWSSYPRVGPWTARRFPTAGEMRTMRDLAIRTAAPSLIVWYSYFDLRSSPSPDRHWQDLVWAAFGHRSSSAPVWSAPRAPQPNRMSWPGFSGDWFGLFPV